MRHPFKNNNALHRSSSFLPLDLRPLRRGADRRSGALPRDADVPSIRAPGLAGRAARAGMARMRRAVDHAVARSPQSLFLRELVTQPGSVGAICASSPRLAQRMASHVQPPADGLVVELGGGTGVITAALLARGVAPERLVVIEQSPALAAHLKRRFPRVHVIHGDAADLAHWHQRGLLPADAAGAPLPVRTIVSGLPLLSIPPAVRHRILAASAEALDAQGQLIQFTYALRGHSPWHGAGFQLHKTERVLANLPPARVDVFAPARRVRTAPHPASAH